MSTEAPDNSTKAASPLSSKKQIPLPLILIAWVLAFPIGIFLIRQLETTIDWYHPFNTAALVLIIVSIVLFFIFAYIGIIPVRNRFERRSGGFLSSFIILLYIEMYGFPLTTFILIWLLGDVPGFIQGFHLFGKIGGYVGQGLVLIGGALVLAGWYDVFYGPPDTLQTKGLYRYVRHPQYLGILLATFGLLIHWVTIILSILFPILVYLYYHLAKIEESYLEEKFGEQFLRYKSAVPMFIPRFRKKDPSKQ